MDGDFDLLNSVPEFNNMWRAQRQMHDHLGEMDPFKVNMCEGGQRMGPKNVMMRGERLRFMPPNA